MSLSEKESEEMIAAITKAESATNKLIMEGAYIPGPFRMRYLRIIQTQIQLALSIIHGTGYHAVHNEEGSLILIRAKPKDTGA